MSFVVSTIPPTIEAWTALQASSTFASPFQSPEYYDFLQSQPNHIPLILTVSSPESSDLRPLSLVLIDLQCNTFRRLTSRAIVHGGPLVSPDCLTEALSLLLCEAIRLSSRHHAVYFEIRPYFDYSQYAAAFSSAGLEYVDYCDCTVDTSSIETIDGNIQPRKMRQVRFALRQGIRFVEDPTQSQIVEFYSLLRRKHWQRSRRPVPSLRYFLSLSQTSFASFLLVCHGDTLVSGSVALSLPPSGSAGHGQLAYHYYVAGKDDEFPHLYPSTIATYQFLLFSNKTGSHHASLMGAGRLSIPFGVRDFKVRMGGKVHPYGRYISVIHPLIYRLASAALNLLHHSDT